MSLRTQEQRLQQCREVISEIVTKEQYEKLRTCFLGGYGPSDYVVAFLDILAEEKGWK